MYAVIRSGGKQYRVAPGDTVKVETLPGKVGGEVTFGDVLAVGTDEKKLLTGADAAKAKVVGKIVEQGRHPKITVFKYQDWRPVQDSPRPPAKLHRRAKSAESSLVKSSQREFCHGT